MPRASDRCNDKYILDYEAEAAKLHKLHLILLHLPGPRGPMPNMPGPVPRPPGLTARAGRGRKDVAGRGARGATKDFSFKVERSLYVRAK